MIEDEVKLLRGGEFKDDRGLLSFCNDFHLDQYKRMYTITHPDVQTVRAWQGHESEGKAFMVLEGSFIIAIVKIDDFLNPSSDLKPYYYKLSAQSTQILQVPKGYANGFKALIPNSRLLILSDLSVEESQRKSVRFDQNLWMDWGKIF